MEIGYADICIALIESIKICKECELYRYMVMNDSFLRIYFYEQ